MDLESELEIAIEAVCDSSGIILKQSEQAFQVKRKQDNSPVTKIDQEVEQRIRKIILDNFPTHSFVGEEFEPTKGTSQFTWYCDPIDGTWAMINGEKTAATSLALGHGEKTVLGVIYNPFTDELFYGAEGIKTTSSFPLPLYNRRSPKEAVYNFQISPRRKELVLDLYGLWEQKEIAKLVSRGGSVAYNLAQVAEGSHSVFIAASSKPSNKWDIAAGVYLVESVGGKVSIDQNKKILIASTNPEIHEKTLDLLAGTGLSIRDS